MTGHQKVDRKNTDRDNRFKKNWKDIFFKCRCKNNIIYLEFLPDLIFSQQTAYDAVEIPGTKKSEGFLVTVNIDKTFLSLYYNYLISILQKYVFGKNFIFWVKTLLKDQQWCILNGGTTTKYFLFGRDAS